MKTQIQKGSSVLRPRARIIKTIGEELISNDIVAILELVKNSYDANASIITINFEGEVLEIGEGKRKKLIFSKTNSKIEIEDDGVGMSLDIIKSAWMEPATLHKKENIHSPEKKRRHTGEKGVGRFAAAKLSSDLKLITKTIDDNEVVADFHWPNFSDDKYLDEIECSWEVRIPELIKKNGTVLILSNLKSDWDEEKINFLRITLSRLINPLSPVPGFLMELNLPQKLKRLSGDIEGPESLKTPVYSIEGNINDSGFLNFKYQSIHIDTPINETIDLSKKLRPSRRNETGPFSFKFFVWDRDEESLKEHSEFVGSTIRDIKRDLNALSGISIYRDNFRVLPYGEPKNDWLRLDIRRVQTPTTRISNNQIIGFIALSLDKNPKFTDQSNREGIVESQAFKDLEEIVKIILNELELRRYKERRRENKHLEKLSLFSNFAIGDYLNLVTTKYPNDKLIADAVKKTENSINEGVKKVQEVLSRYRRLSTLGLLVDAVLHDGNNYLGLISGETAILKKELNKSDLDPSKISEKILKIEEHKQMLSELFKRLEPFGGRKRGRPEEIVIENAIRNVFLLYDFQLKKLNIQVSLPESENKVTIDNGEFQSIIVNLLTNSMYWLENVDYEKKIIIQVEHDIQSLIIVFSDNGPGVDEENQELIFDPYFSTKPDGIGLGLTIIGELMSDYNGELLLIDNGPLNGATFKLIFRNRI
jgi:hypothetical protein